MGKHSRHQRHIKLLRKLVKETDYYIAHVWNTFGRSLHGVLDSQGGQKFSIYGDHTKYLVTPYFRYAEAGKIFFALQPKRNKEQFGLVITGWKDLSWFVNEGVKNK